MKSPNKVKAIWLSLTAALVMPMGTPVFRGVVSVTHQRPQGEVCSNPSEGVYGESEGRGDADSGNVHMKGGGPTTRD